MSTREPEPIQFCSVSGELYSAARIRPVALGVVGRRYGAILKPLLPAWRDKARAILADEKWLRRNNGMTPGGLADELFDALLREIPVGRTVFIDPDFRREPKTGRYCCRCQRDIAPGAPARRIYLRNNGAVALHPADVPAHALPDDIGWALLGPECARAVGADWLADEPTESEPADALVRDRHLDWCDKNRDELRKYPNSWVAIDPEVGIVYHSADGDAFAAWECALPAADRARLMVTHTRLYD